MCAFFIVYSNLIRKNIWEHSSREVSDRKIQEVTNHISILKIHKLPPDSQTQLLLWQDSCVQRKTVLGHEQ